MAEPLKNIYDRKYIRKLADSIQAESPQFNSDLFSKLVFASGWKNLELKQRTQRICESLKQTLPSHYKEALQTLIAACARFGPGSYDKMFFPQFVEMYGRDKKNRKESLKALQFFTQDSSSEFAVRPFILDDPDFMLSWMINNSQHKNHHIRRLASEGCRPRLPWAPALLFLKQNPKPILPILENLKNDPELYVRRSVANCINDITKDHPLLALKFLEKWNRKSPSPEVQWITRHALRGLVKAGNPKALALIGYSPLQKIEVNLPKLNLKNIPIDSHLEFHFEIQNKSRTVQKLLIDYVMYFRKKNGQLNPKVFKLTSKKLSPGEVLTISKKHSFKKISTRVYYPGQQSLQLQINGENMAKVDFNLT